MYKKIIVGIVALCFVYWLPFLIVLLSSRSDIVQAFDSVPPSDAVIVFGTLVNDGEVSPLLQERLDTAAYLIDTEVSDTIVVSNTQTAAEVMAVYLNDFGVTESQIELDTQAETTVDTCNYEYEQYGGERSVLFVSQEFHLPRLMYQCNKAGVEGIGVPAELVGTIDRSQYSWFTKVRVRSSRYIREAALTWLAVLGIYK